MSIQAPEAPLDPVHPSRRGTRTKVSALSFVALAAALLLIALGRGLLGLQLARVENVEIYVTAVNAEQTSIGYAGAPGADAVGTFDLRALDVWANGEDGPWIPVGSHVEDGRPTCIPPGSYGAKVRLTVVSSVFGGRSDLDRVSRLRCLAEASG